MTHFKFIDIIIISSVAFLNPENQNTKSALIVVFVDFRGINTIIMTDFKLPTSGHTLHSWKEIDTSLCSLRPYRYNRPNNFKI